MPLDIPEDMMTYYKAEAKRGSKYHADFFSLRMGSFSEQDHLDVLRIYMIRLRKAPPTFEALQRCTSRVDAPVSECLYVRSALTGIYSLMENHTTWRENTVMHELVQSMWPYVWRWMCDIFLRDCSSLHPYIARHIYAPDVPAVKAFMLSISAGFADEDPLRQILGDTPGFISWAANLWFDSAKPVCDDTDDEVAWAANRLMQRFTIDLKWVELVVQCIGSTLDFAIGILSHIHRLIRQGPEYIRHMETIMRILHRPLTAEIHTHLLAQNSIQTTIRVMNYFSTTTPQPDIPLKSGIASCLQYFMLAFSASRNLDHVRQAFESQIIPALARAAGCKYGINEKESHLPRLRLVLGGLGQHLVYKSYARLASKSLRIVQNQGLEIHFHCPELRETWRRFKILADQLKETKLSYSEVPGKCMTCQRCDMRPRLLQCSICRVYYCSKKCQAADWERGNHRSVCIRRESLDLIPLKEYEYLTWRTCDKVASLRGDMALLYQRYALLDHRNDLPPLKLSIDFTLYPTTLTVYAGTPGAGSSSQITNTTTRATEVPDKRCLIKFHTVLPLGRRRKYLLVPVAIEHQPIPAFYTFEEFTRRHCETPEEFPKAAEGALNFIAAELYPTEESGQAKFVWMTESIDYEDTVM